MKTTNMRAPLQWSGTDGGASGLWAAGPGPSPLDDDDDPHPPIADDGAAPSGPAAGAASTKCVAYPRRKQLLQRDIPMASSGGDMPPPPAPAPLEALSSSARLTSPTPTRVEATTA